MKEGDKFEVVEDSVGFNIGTTVTFIREDEHGVHIMAWFKGVTKFGRVDEWPVLLTRVVPYVEEKPTTKALYGEEEEEVDKYATCEEYTGGSSDYYKVVIKNPTTFDPYVAECNDVIEALDMNFAEGNIFKAIWRKAAARQGKRKAGHNEQYDNEKILFFAQRLNGLRGE